MFRYVIGLGDVEVLAKVQEAVRGCGLIHFQFKESQSSEGGVGWEDGGEYRWMSFTGEQLVKVYEKS